MCELLRDGSGGLALAWGGVFMCTFMGLPEVKGAKF